MPLHTYQQLPFFACPGGQNFPFPACAPPRPGSTTIDPEGVWTAHAPSDVAKRMEARMSLMTF